MITRRSLLGSMLAAGVAPAFVGSGVLMPIRKVWTPDHSLRIVSLADIADSYAKNLALSITYTKEMVAGRVILSNFRVNEKFVTASVNV